jgi:hypothetical protein
MSKKILAVVVGVLIGSTLFFLFGAIGASLSAPIPDDVQISEPGYNAARVEATSTISWLVTLAGIMIGAFLAGLVGGVIAKEKVFWVTTIIGGILSLWVLYGAWAVPEIPLWYDLSSLASYLLFTYFGGMVIRRRGSKGT